MVGAGRFGSMVGAPEGGGTAAPVHSSGSTGGPDAPMPDPVQSRRWSSRVLAWVRAFTQSPYAGGLPERVLRRASVALWTIAAVLGVCGCLLPHGPGVFVPGWWGLTGMAACMAVFSGWRGTDLPVLVEHLMAVTACTAVTLAVLCAHHAEAMYPAASLYVLNAVYTACFFEPAPFATYLVAQLAASAAVMLTSGRPAAVAGWCVMVGVATTAGVTVHLLCRALAAAADSDPLTGLPNRRAMERILLRELARSARRGDPLSVAILDLDGFKAVNDRYGHAAGDRLLVEVSASWAQQLRAGDVLGRVGGDEFVLLLPGTGTDEAARVVERCGERGRHPFSAGVAGPGPSGDLEDLLHRADEACYQAKRRGDRVGVAMPVDAGRVDAVTEPTGGGGATGPRPAALSAPSGPGAPTRSRRRPDRPA